MYAYVTLVMLGDEYVAGAKVLAKSLLCTGTKHDLVCMVTPDVSAEARSELAALYTRVLVVDYVTYKCPPMLTKRQNQMYGSWISYAFTKWQCLTLLEYKKIIYLDADHLVVKSIEHLFHLRAPAMCFTDDNNNYYDRLLYGDTIKPEHLVSFMRYNKILCKGGTVLFEPNVRLYNTILALLRPNNNCLIKCSYHNGFDEQILLQAFIELRVHVTQLSVLYAWNAGAYHRLRKGNEPYVINYYGDVKPWHYADSNRTIDYMDLYTWKWFADKIEYDKRGIKEN
ncbi:P13 [Alphabaculovirus myunipunctae]|uniref:P13 n=1 Tax=Mythimna unipuncta nucleopolyhedrovirus TaxID=447897 RepID=A0A2K9VSB9_9ABAC|nr:P13 [Mythimna unipuncta nucleopolyhedrovirus]AUV65332.1 P13 [Mythimna unipuncta nucleopolyhedrovirus]